MLFSRWYTSPTLSVEGVGNVSRSATATAMFWLALLKVWGCQCARCIAMVWAASSVRFALVQVG
jgi:hypothetical protein